MADIHPFFVKIQQLAQEHGVLAYVVVAAVEKPESIGISTAAGTKLPDSTPLSERVYAGLERAFAVGLKEIIRGKDSPDDIEMPPKGGLLN